MAFFDAANPVCYLCHQVITPGSKATYVRPEGTYLLHQNKCFHAFTMANPRFKFEKEAAQKAIPQQQKFRVKISDVCTQFAIITSLFLLIIGMGHKL